MADTFILNNRGMSSASSTSMAVLEESARDRKNQLEKIVNHLRKMNLHLYSITDENFLEEE